MKKKGHNYHCYRCGKDYRADPLDRRCECGNPNPTRVTMGGLPATNSHFRVKA